MAKGNLLLLRDEPKDTYGIPGGKKVAALTKQLADEIRRHFTTDRENRFQLFLLAAGLRNKHLNKKTDEYSAAFHGWYDAQKLGDLFGKLPNFTKYASAGDVVAYVAHNTSDPTKYLSQLPLSVGTLYEISSLLREHETFVLCLNHTAKRKSLDAPQSEWATKKPPLINAHATEAEVHRWKKNWYEPPQPKIKRTEKRSMVLATIKVSGELYDFDRKTGDKIGCVDLPDVEQFLRDIERHFTAKNDKQFKLEKAVEVLTEGYYKRKDRSDPARKILPRATVKQMKKKS